LVLGGGRRLPEGRIEYEEEALREVVHMTDARSLTSLPELPGLETRLPDMLRSPWPDGRTYWKFACKGACQDLFFLAKLNQVETYLSAVTAEAARYNYPGDSIGVYIQPMAYGGACHIEFNFFYDSTNTAEADTVRNLYGEAARAAFNRGAFFSRPYGTIADMVYSQAAGYAGMSWKLKGVMDANAIMSPGRLCR
jgi:hypothetical protein